jgi:hypothetical protein
VSMQASPSLWMWCVSPVSHTCACSPQCCRQGLPSTQQQLLTSHDSVCSGSWICCVAVVRAHGVVCLLACHSSYGPFQQWLRMMCQSHVALHP